MRATTIAASLLGCTLLMGSAAHAQAARHYDCTKPGNANKTACKTAAAAAPASTSSTTTTTTAPVKAERHYDCSKAGNANKAICKGASAPAAAAPTASQAPAPAKKPSILDVLRSRPSPAAAAADTAPHPAPANDTHAGKSITSSPAGATGQCKDGSYTHATHHSGACSHHGGVAKWMNG